MTIQSVLTNLTGVSNWDSINFGILPNESPKGYLFPLRVDPNSPSRQVITYGVAIAVSGADLEGLGGICLEISQGLARAFKSGPVCSEDLGVIRLIGPIDINAPQSYPNQSNVSLTTGFFTAITFTLEVG